MSKSADAFRTISEVADWLGVQTHVLRFWESKFTQVKPVKRAGGRRYYRPVDMLLLGGIRKLLHDDGLTIKGVQKVLREKGIAHVSAMSSSLDEASAAIPADVSVKLQTQTASKDMQDVHDTSTLDLFDTGAEPDTHATITKFARPEDVQPTTPEAEPRPSFTQDAVVMPGAAPSAPAPQAAAPVTAKPVTPQPVVPEQPQTDKQHTDEPPQVALDDTAAAPDDPTPALASDTPDETVADTATPGDSTPDDAPELPMPAPTMEAIEAEPTATADEDEENKADTTGSDAAEPDAPEVMFKASAPPVPDPAPAPTPAPTEATPEDADDAPASEPMPQMPAFIRRTSPLSPPESADEAQGDELPEADAQPEPDVQVAASDPAIEAPADDVTPPAAPVLKPDIIDMPDTPPDSEFPAQPALLTALTTAKSASPEATALLSQLAALRDKMIAAHKE